MALQLVDNVMHVKANSTMRLFSPAKVNLHLAVTGKRDDGFHELISLVSPISFGDYLTVTRLNPPAGIEFSCSDESVPTGEANLVVQAARAFLDSVDSSDGLKIHLEKLIPMEAGLGGGSSNAATTLLILNELFGEPKDVGGLSQLAENLGSVESLVTHSVTMTHADMPVEERLAAGITDGLVRLSAGLESADDLIADLKQALDGL